VVVGGYLIWLKMSATVRSLIASIRSPRLIANFRHVLQVTRSASAARIRANLLSASLVIEIIPALSAVASGKCPELHRLIVSSNVTLAPRG
jgi:hypothetical protein